MQTSHQHSARPGVFLGVKGRGGRGRGEPKGGRGHSNGVKGNCNLCGKPGHWKKDCPDKDKNDQDLVDKAIKEVTNEDKAQLKTGGSSSKRKN